MKVQTYKELEDLVPKVESDLEKAIMVNKRVILKPKTAQKGVYNPTICENYIFYRVEDKKGVSSISRSKYKIEKGRIKVLSKTAKPIIAPEHDYEVSGCEDPRIVRIGNKFFMTYVGSAKRGSLCLAESSDLTRWEKKGAILEPACEGWDSRQVKAGAILPHKIDGYYYMFYLGEVKPWHTNIGIVRSKNIYEWERFLQEPILTPRKGYFDSQGVEPCSTLYDESINANILIYAGWDKGLVHQGGVALFSMESPEKIVYRRSTPFLEPTEPWERCGKVPNVVFPTGVIEYHKKIHILWGAADKVIGEKPFSLEELLGANL
ncbi:MAG: hypothetical protein Q8O03_04865 [Nanoarchaeota archaeon]|nr:hypothetical protein [Nanoarchaeota archaeon]